MAYSASWKGITFDQIQVDLTTVEAVEAARLTRKTAAWSCCLAGLSSAISLSILGRRWLMHRGADGIFVGPLGTIYGYSLEWNYQQDVACDESLESLMKWLRHYDFCTSSNGGPVLIGMTLCFGWTGVLFTLLAGLTGIISSVNVSYSAHFALLGVLCLLSSLICFLNWNYVSDLMFEQAFIFVMDGTTLGGKGPATLQPGFGLLLMIISFFIELLSATSLMVIYRRKTMLDAAIQSSK
jgi:hypothetical protein